MYQRRQYCLKTGGRES